MELKVIAHIRTEFPQKFGIPRQSGLVPELRGRIVFEPEFACEDAVRGLDGFSHVWLLWQFQDVEDAGGTAGAGDADVAAGAGGPGAATEGVAAGNAHLAEGAACVAPRAGAARGWRPLVRPPALGGNRRLGVFATRSPFRPNPIGLSCVELERVEARTPEGPVLHVRGADLRDGTPIFDIKPYLPAADAHPEARGGFTQEAPWRRLQVECAPDLLECVPSEVRAALLGVLAEDPRPARQRTHGDKVYRLSFAGFDVSFTVADDTLHVRSIEPASA